jgi:putative AlgH/UPF0301 family transcriptional regulator
MYNFGVIVLRVREAELMQAVILVTSHDESGTTGLILNKPLEHLIGKS